MKIKKMTGVLALRKSTVSNLNRSQMDQVWGGQTWVLFYEVFEPSMSYCNDFKALLEAYTSASYKPSKGYCP